MVRSLIGFLATCFACLAAHAQPSYPERPIKLVIAFAAGGAPDIMGRAYADRLREQLGQPVIVDNKPGATGAIGADAVAKAPGDGYTLLLNSSAMVINPWVVKQPFDFQRDLVPVIRTAETPYLMTINPTLPIRNLEEFVAYAKKNPGKLMCGTYGIASPPHLALELLKKEAGIDVVHIPYKTFAQALPDLLSGELACSIDPPTVPAPPKPKALTVPKNWKSPPSSSGQCANTDQHDKDRGRWNRARGVNRNLHSCKWLSQKDFSV
jgi:tripartite-type tricarboxylate transporter receptor subunit TctC